MILNSIDKEYSFDQHYLKEYCYLNPNKGFLLKIIIKSKIIYTYIKN